MANKRLLPAFDLSKAGFHDFTDSNYNQSSNDETAVAPAPFFIWKQAKYFG
ncbi:MULTISPECIES: hypothetical protein [Acinetobacter]|uniref:hypothetical protein n=1 Tax=Acinetobacter TaxID=469 RepID=UPI0015D1AA36|nr:MULTISPECIES: hypothetical protein [Acinetobacter]MCO8090214.1 hypothetical protein [Acinetobacter pseudolwoffii]